MLGGMFMQVTQHGFACVKQNPSKPKNHSGYSQKSFISMKSKKMYMIMNIGMLFACLIFCIAECVDKGEKNPICYAVVGVFDSLDFAYQVGNRPDFFSDLSSIHHFDGSYIAFICPVDKKIIARCLYEIERKKVFARPKKIFFRPTNFDYFEDDDNEDRAINSMRCFVKEIVNQKQAHFYAGLFLNKKRRENQEWRLFPEELRDNILVFIGHPYDGIE